MSQLRSRLPPTNALVTFEAVARNLSFTGAARELGVSQAATSRQIRNLEEHLAVRLLDRDRRRTRLTPAGEELYMAVSMALSHIANTTDRLRRAGRDNTLTVATSIAFSTFWLMPRLGRLHARHPDLELRLVTSDVRDDWLAGDIDIAVVFGRHGGPGSNVETLFGDQIVAVCHPDYFKGRPKPETVSALPQETLLHMESEHPTWLSWTNWLESCGLQSAPKLSGPHFSTYTITVQAALDGRGIALGWRRLIDRFLRDGSLVQVTSAVLVPDDCYSLVRPAEPGARSAARAFRDWIVEEAGRDWSATPAPVQCPDDEV